ncbi:MAG: glycosyltransferase family 4 protein [Deltaproteobacteria bacterium]|nr:glycosyltransferase family 4 protein [Deltaproteobacteria bacterium]
MARAAIFCVLIDPGHDIAGFVLSWIKGLARRVDSLEVIALEVVDAQGAGLPANVRLTSLGKEKGFGRPRLLVNSQRAVWRAMDRADFLLCHMMPVYALAAGPICRLKGKPLLLWYTHQHVDLKLRAAVRAADRVLTAVPESMRVPTAKKRVLGHGIDTDRFCPGPDRPRSGPLRVVSVGRLSPVKRLEVLVEAAEKLKAWGRLEDFRFSLVGQEGEPFQKAYTQAVKDRIKESGLEGVFEFTGSIPYAGVADSFRQADLFVSMQEQRGLDKAVLEAMACGLPVVVANRSFVPLLGDQAGRLVYPPDQPQALAQKLIDLAQVPAGQRRALGLDLRAKVQAEHDLGRLMDRILNEAAEAGR